MIQSEVKYQGWDPNSVFTDSNSNSHSHKDELKTKKLYESFELKPWGRGTGDTNDSNDDIGDDDSLYGNDNDNDNNNNNNNDDDNNDDDIRDSLEMVSSPKRNSNSNSININRSMIKDSIEISRTSKKYNSWDPQSIFDDNYDIDENINSNTNNNINRKSNNDIKKKSNNDNNSNINDIDMSRRSSNVNNNNYYNNDVSRKNNNSVIINNRNSNSYIDDDNDDDSLEGNIDNYKDSYNDNYNDNYNETNVAVTDIQRLIRGHLGRKAANRVLLHNERNKLKLKQKMKAQYLDHKDDKKSSNSIIKNYKLNTSTNTNTNKGGDNSNNDVLFFKANHKVVPKTDGFSADYILEDYNDKSDHRTESFEEYHIEDDSSMLKLKENIDFYNQYQEYRQSKEVRRESKEGGDEVHYFSMKRNKKNSPTAQNSRFKNYDHEAAYVISSSPLTVPGVAPEKKIVTDAILEIKSNAKSSSNGVKYGIKDLQAQYLTPLPDDLQQHHHQHHQQHQQHQHQRYDLIEHDEAKRQQQEPPKLTEFNNKNENRNHQIHVANGYSHQHHHHGQLDQSKKKRRIRRHRAAVTIQRTFRGYLGRKRAHARRKLWVDKFKCPNCGRLEQTGVYCKGCGRRIHSEKVHLKKQIQSQAAGNWDNHKQKQREEPSRDPRYEHSSNSKRGDQAERMKERADRKPAAPTPYLPSRNQASPRRQEREVSHNHHQQQHHNVNLESTTALNSIESKLLEEISALDRKQKLRMMEKQLEKDIYDLDDQLHHHGGNIKITSIANKESKVKENEKLTKPMEQKRLPTVTKEKLAFGPGAKDFRSKEAPPIGVKKKINNVEGPTSPVIKKVGMKLQKKSTDEQVSTSPSPSLVDQLGVPSVSKVPVPIVMSPGYMHVFNKKGKTGNSNNNNNNNNNMRQKNGDDNSRLGSISEH